MRIDGFPEQSPFKSNMARGLNEALSACNEWTVLASKRGYDSDLGSPAADEADGLGPPTWVEQVQRQRPAPSAGADAIGPPTWVQGQSSIDQAA